MRAAVLLGARQELVDFGYAEFRIERVAERSGVHKTTLYRQWGTKTALVRDAIFDWHHAQFTEIDAGSWAADVLELCRMVAAIETSPVTQALLRTLVTASVIDPKLTDELHQLWEEDAAILRKPIIRAKERGEVAAEIDPQHVIELITGPLVQRSIVSAMSLDAAFVESLAAIVLAGTIPMRQG